MEPEGTVPTFYASPPLFNWLLSLLLPLLAFFAGVTVPLIGGQLPQAPDGAGRNCHHFCVQSHHFLIDFCRYFYLYSLFLQG